eukprot:Hpha_TRINITY_DN1128_c0_g1::TRINITY_DN1128_c0_g1_i1::g.113150::m.113150/K20359/RABAC1, PRAF1; PRA1 family protein 1
MEAPQATAAAATLPGAENPFSFGNNTQPTAAEELVFIDTEAGAQGDGVAGPIAASQTGAAALVANTFAALKDFRSKTMRGMRPWSEFVNPKEFTVPQRSNIFNRLTINGKYYWSNYMCIVALLAVWTALSNLFFVASTVIMAVAYNLYKFQTKDGGPFVLMGREVTAIQFYAGLTASSLFLFWLSGGSSTIFWLIASTAGTIGGHAITREPVDALTLSRMALEGDAVDETFTSTFGSDV